MQEGEPPCRDDHGETAPTVSGRRGTRFFTVEVNDILRAAKDEGYRRCLEDAVVLPYWRSCSGPDGEGNWLAGFDKEANHACLTENPQ